MSNHLLLLLASSRLKPAFSHNFLSGTIPGIFTFSRASSGTYRGSDGLLKTALTDVARFEYSAAGSILGLLLEDTKTNLLTRSEEFSDAAWTKAAATVSANAAVAPDGATTADALVEDNTSAEHYNQQSISVTSGERTTFSVFAKQGVGTRAISLRVATSAVARVDFNLINGTKTDSVTTNLVLSRIEPWGNGWYRCSITVTAAATGSMICRIHLTNGTTVSYTGDNTSSNFLFGAQAEVSDFPSSYILTTTASVARAKDSIFTTNMTALGRNISEGSIIFNGMIPYNQIGGSRQNLFQLDDNTNNERHFAGNDPNSSSIVGRTTVGGAGQSALTSSAITFGTPFKYGYAYKLNDFAGVLNGGTVQTDTSGSLPATLTYFRLGQQQSLQALNGYVRGFSYYNQRVSNNVLKGLTV
jgi:hypothetical protein